MQELIELITLKELIAIGLIVFLVICINWAAHCERKQWNGGFAPDGSEWKLFDRSTYGDRGYVSADGEHHIWISYNVDKRPYAGD